MKPPKYKYEDLVMFRYGGDTLTGVIYIVDAYGTLEQNKEPSYDIYNEQNNTLYKHIRESDVFKIG